MVNKTMTQLKIKLSQLRIDQTNLQVEAKGLCRSIGDILVPELHEIEDMEVSRAAGYMDDLMVKQAELLTIQRKIWELEAALGK